MRVGVFGGSFNPVHFGHLSSANEVMCKMKLDRVYFVVSARPPHKPANGLIDFTHRCEMVKLATVDNDAFYLSEIEGQREGPSYTIDTMRYFQDKFGEEVYFIAGQDAMEDVGSWNSAETLLKSCNFIVMTRPGYDPSTLAEALQVALELRYKNVKLKSVAPRPMGTINIFGVTGGSTTLSIVSVTPLDISSSVIRGKIAVGESIQYQTPEAVEMYLNNGNLIQREPLK